MFGYLIFCLIVSEIYGRVTGLRPTLPHAVEIRRRLELPPRQPRRHPVAAS